MTIPALGTPPFISVIVPTFRRQEAVLRTVSDLLAQDYARFEIIVADQNVDWSPDHAARLESLRSDSRVRWFSLPTPGVVIARNQAAAISTGDTLLFVDDDVWIPDRAFLDRHGRAHRDPTVACVCGRVLSVSQVDQAKQLPLVPAVDAATATASGTTLAQLLSFDRSQASPAEVAVFGTGNGSIKRGAFDRVGGFDENFRGASYGDDADLALRLHSAGERTIYDPRPWLVHLEEPMGGLRLSDPTNPFSEYDRCLSGLIFTFRHAGPREFWPLVYGWVLRRSVFLRRNLTRPWRQPAAVWGLLWATLGAWRAVRRGPQRHQVASSQPLA